MGSVPLAEFRRLRGSVRSVFPSVAQGSCPVAAEVEFLNRTSRLSPAYPTLVWRGRTRSREMVLMATGDLDRLLATLAASATPVVTNGGKHGVTVPESVDI